MNSNTQSRTGASTLAALVIAASVGLGVVGCAEHPSTPLASSVSGETSTATEARTLVDVSAVWQNEPLPDCPKPPIVFNGAVPPGLSLPDKSSVARELQGVRSPGSPQWVKTKLGWVTQELAVTRADIIDANTPGDSSMTDGFNDYVRHVRAELEAGHDIPDPIDKTYPEGCS